MISIRNEVCRVNTAVMYINEQNKALVCIDGTLDTRIEFTFELGLIVDLENVTLLYGSEEYDINVDSVAIEDGKLFLEAGHLIVETKLNVVNEEWQIYSQ